MDTKKMVNIYDKEKNPNETCDKIKNMWKLSCNQIVKENHVKKFKNSTQCQKLFNDYSQCYIQHLLKNTNNM